MKKVSKTLSKNYLTARIFIDELNDIQNILTESSERFEIKAGDYVFTSVEELNNKYLDRN